VRPFLLVADCCDAGPTEALPAYADAIPNCAPASLYKIKEAILNIDDDGAWRFSGRIVHGLAQIAWIHAPIDADSLLLQVRVQSARARRRLARQGRLHTRLSRTLVKPKEMPAILCRCDSRDQHEAYHKG